MLYRMEREKKNISRILTKFSGVVGSLSETAQKKFELLRWRRKRRVGGSQGHFLLKKSVFFLFFSASQNGLRFM